MKHLLSWRILVNSRFSQLTRNKTEETTFEV